MNYKDRPNLLLEALAYLGRKASGNTWDHLEQKIKHRKLKDKDSFHETFSKIKKLTIRMDENISLGEDIINKYFTNLEGFPFNTIGSTSVAFLLFYNVLEEFDEDFDTLISYMKDFSPDRIAYNIAEALDISDNCNTPCSLSDREFLDKVLSLSVPAESKITILDTYHNYHEVLNDISVCLNTIINTFKKEKNALTDIIDNFSIELVQTGCIEYFKQISKLKLVDEIDYHMQPFIFGMDTNLTSNQKINTVHIYCGILRKDLLDMLNGQISYIDDIYEAYHLLGDRTRFDILCYLRKQSAYGLELSNHLNVSRNTIHHHMSKLINYGLVICTTDGKRVYYSLDTEAFEMFIMRQKDLFCNKN
ncbi:ArsR/SmtB family transcription factor [Clostridium nigeriense]|uniref:ArsR/SmtB family transcription factor n=1 Tax=Clostridium nigeriense TaxID=1805470 RepID=UPI003D3272AB